VQLSLKPIKNKALQATDLKQLCSFFFFLNNFATKTKKGKPQDLPRKQLFFDWFH